ncbi:PREDICTED: uncharacterized protein LOC105978041 [Erythranthe guttata]|uniref:uncharacterized protein LOC105978041 n=1 Tax=Erythranthe guttata TaxID=4155 RepID=UPI00064DF20C|nr:PREDICTED: uncharacterized protein LOC105978041 [Erythranthe guttata]|eukprot:XP_012858907.1 PREDICTED: uncharacterized protein LOC105978041 [Erythranthe guttata]
MAGNTKGVERLMLDLKNGKYLVALDHKRDLPYAHILLWLHNKDNPKTSKDIDKIICAEIPDKMVIRVFRIRENGRAVVKKKIYLDNGFVVPYNRALLKKYRAHINVELCNKYLSACEAAWSLFSFDIHFRDPPAIRLTFYLLDSQAVVFTDNNSLVDVLNRLTANQTMFLAWFHANKLYHEARNLRDCTCYDDLRKVEDHVYPTFKDACFALGLLDDDKEYIAGIKEANEWASCDYVRRIFVILLGANNMSRPEYVWECCCKEFAEDIAYRLQQRRTNSCLYVSDDTLRNYALIEIENILQSNNRLSNFPPLPIPIGSMTDATVNRLVLDDLDYDDDAIREELKKYLSSITDDHKKVFDDIMDAVTNDRGGLFFLYGHGGTGKTFIWKTLSAAICSKGDIVINVASSDMPFGGKVVVLGGDFRQIMSIVLKASRQYIGHATVNSSPLWIQCKIMKLNKKMRLESSSTSANADEIREFADWILIIDNGDAGEVNDGDVTIDDMLIRTSAILFGSYRVFLSRSVDQPFHSRVFRRQNNSCTH